MLSMENGLPSKFARHKAQEMFYSVLWSTEDAVANRNGPIDLAEKKESWLAKLGSWTEALAVYEQKISSNPRDFEALLGCMRCLDASGEWRRVLELAERSWPALSASSFASQKDSMRLEQEPEPSSLQAYPRSQKKALRLCAQAAWRLGQWDDLEKFATELNSNAVPAAKPMSSFGPREIVGHDFDGSFFSAVLHIHKKEWALAAEAIDGARKAMAARFSALMAESYNRAYPSMVTAQTLAELEVSQFRAFMCYCLVSFQL